MPRQQLSKYGSVTLVLRHRFSDINISIILAKRETSMTAGDGGIRRVEIKVRFKNENQEALRRPESVNILEMRRTLIML